MQHAAFVEEFNAIKAAFVLQTEQAANCYGLQAYPDPGAAIAGITTLIDAGLMMPDSSEPRKCEACGLWHIRGIER